MAVGLVRLEVLLLPKSQVEEVKLPVDVLVNCTTAEPHPNVGVAVKLAVS